MRGPPRWSRITSHLKNPDLFNQFKVTLPGEVTYSGVSGLSLWMSLGTVTLLMTIFMHNENVKHSGVDFAVCNWVTNVFLNGLSLSQGICMLLPESASATHEFCLGKRGQFLLFIAPSPTKSECLSPPPAFSLIPHTPGDTGCPAGCPPHSSPAWRFPSEMSFLSLCRSMPQLALQLTASSVSPP